MFWKISVHIYLQTGKVTIRSMFKAVKCAEDV